MASDKRLELDVALEVSSHTDEDANDSAEVRLRQALQDAKSSDTPVVFEIWKHFLPAEAAL